jgi:hypothetical protein
MAEGLSVEVRCKARIQERWSDFRAGRAEWLRQGERFGRSPEKIAENIITDLFTDVLDWPRGNINFQVERSDILLTHLGIRRLLVEMKAPDSLRTPRAVESALLQATRYATVQYVKAVGASDGRLLYVADFLGGTHRDRILVFLDNPEPPMDLWLVSVHGIYRDCPRPSVPLLKRLMSSATDAEGSDTAETNLTVVGKTVGGEKRPAECFAFVGDIAKPGTWKLPYLLASCEPDPKRLPMAVGAVLRNYRGRSVEGIPEAAIPEVLFRLGRAAWKLRRFPDQVPNPPVVFRDLKETLLQLGLWDETRLEESPAWDQMDRTPGT